MAVDFVISKLNRSVGTRAKSAQAPVHYEIPPDVIREAVVNAVAHRDYTSAGAIQVSVFADRVEVWNPGTLPPPLTPESLRQPHGSIARNPRICEALFLTRYIEKYGTGTLMMIRECLAHALPEPDFIQRGGEFTITDWRDWLTDEVVAEFHMSNRQRQAVIHAKSAGRISTSGYRDITKVSESTALRELRQLTKLGVLKKVEDAGRAIHYIVAKMKPVINPSNPPQNGTKWPYMRHKETMGTFRNRAINPPIVPWNESYDLSGNPTNAIREGAAKERMNDKEYFCRKLRQK